MSLRTGVVLLPTGFPPPIPFRVVLASSPSQLLMIPKSDALCCSPLSRSSLVSDSLETKEETLFPFYGYLLGANVHANVPPLKPGEFVVWTFHR